MVLVPVPVPAPPHLVDPPLGNPGTELRLVVNDGRLGKVVHLPAGSAQPELQVDLLRIEEELLVEEPDLLEGVTPDDEGGSHDPVDPARRLTAGLHHACPAERQEPESADEGRGEAPR